MIRGVVFFDVDGTLVPHTSRWHGTLANLSKVIAGAKSRYGKPVVIAETAYLTLCAFLLTGNPGIG